MRGNLIAIITFLIVLAFGSNTISAQITINLPQIKIGKPNKDGSKIKDVMTKTNPTILTSGNGDSATSDLKTLDSKLIYSPQRPTNVPVFLKNSVYVEAVTTDEYWKMKGQRDYSSWVPTIRFDQFYNEERNLNYTVEYFNPDGSLWYSEKLGESGRNAERTVLYQSPNPFGSGIINTKSTNGIGVYGFKITNQDTKEVLYQGKFKVGKYSRGHSPQEKNKLGFYVEHDWLLPFGTIGFHHSLDEVGAMSPELSVWLKGSIQANELEARVFYQNRQVATTKDAGGASDYDTRASDSAAAFVPNNVWKRWQFSWRNFLFDNNGSFNRENFPDAFYADKNPGDYTVKIYRNGTQIRELGFTIGADGRIVVPGYSNQIPMPYYRVILPVKITDKSEKWDSAAWKTDAFYGNPLTGFTVQ
jgi:hypothetical protein